MPAFGPLAVKGMIEGMREICGQLLSKVRPTLPNPCTIILTHLTSSGNGQPETLIRYAVDHTEQLEQFWTKCDHRPIRRLHKDSAGHPRLLFDVLPVWRSSYIRVPQDTQILPRLNSFYTVRSGSATFTARKTYMPVAVRKLNPNSLLL
jgi:hypothetical protein